MFRQRFKTYTGELTGNHISRIKDLASAKHRFTSHSVPCGRAVLYCVPLVRCAQSILDERGRSSSEGRDASLWLAELNDETACQLALMADCADEALILNRFLGADGCDKTALTSELANFLKTATWMVEERGALTTGYTLSMTQTLKAAQRTIFIDNKPTRLGGPGPPSAATLDKVCQRMANLLQLCRHTTMPPAQSLDTHPWR